MATLHFINTQAGDISQARTRTLTNLQPAPFPPLVSGDAKPSQFFFAADGVMESWSGANNYALALSLGDINSAPRGGTYTLTCGYTTDPLPFDSNAAAIQAALNALPTVVTYGGVTVMGEFPDFIIYSNASGMVTPITGSASLLTPDSTITFTILRTGGAGVWQQARLSLRTSTLLGATNWTQITSPYVGWSGNLNTNTNTISAMLIAAGDSTEGIREMDTILTIAVNYTNANTVTTSTYYQGPVKVRLP